MTVSPGPRWTAVLIRLSVSVGLVAGLAWVVDVRAVMARLSQFDARWVVLAVAISLLQVGASAWRWRFTAGRLGIDLSFRDALREYYLAMFLNQVLPGGVMGDVSRAWRHARAQGEAREPRGAAVRAVLLERVSGQVVMTTVAAASVVVLPATLGTGRWMWWTSIAVLAVAVGLVAWARRRWSNDRSLARRLWRETRAALWTGGALAVQLTSSAVVVGTYLAIYVVAARAIGVGTPIGTLLPLIAPVLVTMLIPVTIAGWGVREGAAASLWRLVGLPVSDGAAISVAYGLLVLLTALPGALILVAGGRRRW